MLKSPFPWFGGKSKVAGIVWDRFGNVPNYVEPFAGSLAVLLGRPHEPKTETVNDKDAFLSNFWRALRDDPEAVAYHADQPVNENDLHARHWWLVNQTEHVERMNVDPDYYDAKIAGWWVWGLCCWIGSGWCANAPEATAEGNSGRGIHRPSQKRPQRATAEGVSTGQASSYRTWATTEWEMICTPIFTHCPTACGGCVFVLATGHGC